MLGTTATALPRPFIYIPNTHYIGPDSFTYTWSDGIVASGVATASLEVYNTPPVATGVTYEIPQGGQLELLAPGLLANVSDFDGDVVQVAYMFDFKMFGPQWSPEGELYFDLDVAADGTFLFRPPSEWVGIVDIMYSVKDGLSKDYATVRVFVGDHPILLPDTYIVPENGILDIVSPSDGVLGNDYDRFGRPLQPRLVPGSVPPLDIGEIQFRADGTFTFLAGPAWRQDSVTTFQYEIPIQPVAGNALVVILVGIVVLVAKGCASPPPPSAPTTPLPPNPPKVPTDIQWAKAHLLKRNGNEEELFGTKDVYAVPLGNSGDTILVGQHKGPPRKGYIYVRRGDFDPRYNCHAYTFGGVNAPGGPFIIPGSEVPKILRRYYEEIGEGDVQPNDIVVFYKLTKPGPGHPVLEVVHSAVVREVVRKDGRLDENATKFRTKNGNMLFQESDSLCAMKKLYEDATVIKYYRLKKQQQN